MKKKRFKLINLEKVSFTPIISKAVYLKKNLWIRESKKTLKELMRIIAKIEPSIDSYYFENSTSIELNKYGRYIIKGFVYAGFNYNGENTTINIQMDGSIKFSGIYESESTTIKKFEKWFTKHVSLRTKK